MKGLVREPFVDEVRECVRPAEAYGGLVPVEELFEGVRVGSCRPACWLRAGAFVRCRSAVKSLLRFMVMCPSCSGAGL